MDVPDFHYGRQGILREKVWTLQELNLTTRGEELVFQDRDVRC